MDVKDYAEIPRRELALAGKMYPDAWRYADEMRARRKKGDPEWPDWVFLPSRYWESYLQKRSSVRLPATGEPLINITHLFGLEALSAWRPTQSVYLFDEALGAALDETDYSREIPGHIFNLPEWSIYVTRPNWILEGVRTHGAFIWLQVDPRCSRPVFNVLYLLDVEVSPHAGRVFPFCAYLDAPSIIDGIVEFVRSGDGGIMWTPDEGFSAETGDLSDWEAEFACRLMGPAISMALYLCSESPDVISDRPLGVRPTPKKTKRGLRLFPPKQYNLVQVGSRISRALRETAGASRGETTRQSRKRPHVRRAHWHTYRVGPGRKDARLKWIAPILVNKDLGEMPTTVVPVTGDEVGAK